MLLELKNQYCSDCLRVYLLCYSGKKSLGEPLPYLQSTISIAGANSFYINPNEQAQQGHTRVKRLKGFNCVGDIKKKETHVQLLML
jgi:hypothetical protein